MNQIDPLELKRRLDSGEKLRLIDVREPQELDVARIAGAELLPLSDILRGQGDLTATGGPYVLFCHHGMRSMRACAHFEARGVQGLHNLVGGIDAWSQAVDPEVPRY